MKYKQYRLKFYINIRHFIYLKGTKGKLHPHTWEICLNILKTHEEFVLFKQMEQEINQFLEQYQDKVLNDMEPFQTINPTLENYCEYISENIGKMLNGLGYILLMIEISETPSKSYIITFLDDEYSRREQELDVYTDKILNQIKQS